MGVDEFLPRDIDNANMEMSLKDEYEPFMRMRKVFRHNITKK